MPASNSFGSLFRITTFGESHGAALGVVIDGMPSGIAIDMEKIAQAMQERQGKTNPFTTPRKEEDLVELLSGVYEGVSTGAPIALLIKNKNQHKQAYSPIKNLLRPGHANFTWQKKYGVFDPYGGGRASARETACRCAAGAIAKMVLETYGIQVFAFLDQLGKVKSHFPQNLPVYPLLEYASIRQKSKLCTIDPLFEEKAWLELEKIKQEQDSLGGTVTCLTSPLPVGLGEPIYEKLQSKIAGALFSIPACKGVEFGSGFAISEQKGSESNDLFTLHKGDFAMQTNHAGGTLGGISNGAALIVRSAFKPTSSIKKSLPTYTFDKKEAMLELPAESRHDVAICLRAPYVVEAMVAITLVDLLLLSGEKKCTF